MASEPLRCIRCDKPGNVRGCTHRGKWHAGYSDCGPRCALGLGWSNLGIQHWGCCYSSQKDSLCPKAAHVFEDLPPQDADEDMGNTAPRFGKSDCPRFRVNLDEEPKKRWVEIASAYKEQLPAVMEMIDGVLGTGLAAGAAETAFAGMTKIGGVHFGEELEGIAETIGIGVGKVAIMQVAYEVFAACTSIVVDCQPAVGDAAEAKQRCPFHIRTMDWEFEQLQALTIEVDFVKGGQTLYTCTTWPGYVGVMTAMRPGAFSVSVNYRRSPAGAEQPLKGVIQNMLRGLRQHWPVSFLVREVLQQAASYGEAVSYLSASELMAPTYIIIAGAREGEGIVITRDRRGQNVPEVGGDLTQGEAAAEAGSKCPDWLLSRDGPVVQANMDHWRDANDPSSEWQDIEDSIFRRAVARQAISTKGASITPEDLWLLLSTHPCKASDTVYTTSMCASTGHFCTRVNVKADQERAGHRHWRRLIDSVRKDMRSQSRQARVS